MAAIPTTSHASLPSDGPAPAQPADLIRNAVRRGDRRVVIPPGTYRLADGIFISNAHDLEIVADGVTLVFTRLSRAINFSHCTHVTLRGAVIDYDPLPFTQGKVIAVGPDQGWVDVRLDAGYPRVAYSRIDVCDPKTRTRKRGMPFLWGTRAAKVGGDANGDVVRLSREHLGATAAVGDLVSLSGGPVAGGQPHGIALDHCGGMSFQDVTVHTAPGMGILEADGEGGTRYTNVRVVPGPPPDGATEPRLLSTAWDALQCKTCRVGPTLEGCEVRDAGDDSWSVQSADYVVLSSSGREAVIGYRDEYCDGPQTGERLRAGCGVVKARIVDRHAVDVTRSGLPADITAKLKEAGPWAFWHVGRKMLRVTLDRETPFAVGQSVYCPDRQCNGFAVRRCKFHSPGRGALVKGGRGVIEDNEFVDCHSAVTINAELPDGAASGIAEVVIRNNRVRGTGYFCPMYESNQAGAVSVVGKPCPVRNVTIEGNQFDDIDGVSICLIGVKAATIEGNRFTRLHAVQPQNTGGSIGVDQHCVLFVSDGSNVHASANTADAFGPFTKSLVGGDYFRAHSDAAQALVVSEKP